MSSYEWWRRALTGEKIGGPTLPVHDGEPQLGFYRRRTSKAGGYVGVAIFEHEGHVVAIRNGEEADAAAEWSWVARYPISEETYRTWEKTGKWPDEDASTTNSLATPPASQEPGANNPPTDPKEVLRGQIDACLAGVADYDRIDTDEAAAKAQGLRSRLLELSNAADKEREKQVRPHLDAQKEVNGMFMPLVRDAKAGADTIRQAISAHETRALKARQEAEAKAAAEERARQKAAAEEARKAEEAGQPAPPPPEPAPTPQAAPAPAQVRGAYGRAATKKLVKKARVVDYAAATAAMATHPELKALVDKLAQRAVDAGVTVAGVEFDEVVQIV